MLDILDVSVDMRPCIVTHKVKGHTTERNAIFHKWISSVVSTSTDVIVQTLALVEYEDGTVAQVKPKSIRFIDNVVWGIFKSLEEVYEEDTQESLQMS